MSSAATSYTTKTKATQSPLVFSPTVKTGLTKVHGFSSSAFEFTSKTLNAVVGVAGSVGSRVGGIGASKTNKDGTSKPPGAVGYPICRQDSRLTIRVVPKLRGIKFHSCQHSSRFGGCSGQTSAEYWR